MIVMLIVFRYFSLSASIYASAGGLSVDSILAADPEQVHDCIRAVGFHNTKLKNLFAIARILKDK